jgi:hypothetical protein
MEDCQVISPTVTQAFGLSMSDFIHPTCIKYAPTNEAYNDYTNVVLDSGTRGSGKTDKAIWEMKLEIDKGFGNEWSGIVFRRTYNDLEDFINKADNFFEMLGYKFSIKRGNGAKIKFETGEQILFRIMRTAEDYNKYHGHGYQFILFEEGTLWFEIMDLVYQMMSCLRSPYNEKYKNEIIAGKKSRMVLKMRITTNPFGVGLMQLKKVFVDNRTEGEAFIIDGITYIHFLSSFLDNPYIPNSYANSFYKLNNTAKRDAWLWADWNAKSSGCFGDLWDTDVFCLPNFKIPTNWRVNRSMDWGTSKPFSILWWAECDGTEVIYEKITGEKVSICPPKGTLILIDEWYGNNSSEGQNVGLYMTATDVAKGIIEKDEIIMRRHLEVGHFIEDGQGDNSTGDFLGHDDTIMGSFNKQGVYWLKADKSKGSRVRGVEVMIDMMQNTINRDNDQRHIYVFHQNVPNWIDNVMSLMRDDKNSDDVDTTGCDHDWDATKYRITGELEYEHHTNSL